MSSSLKLVTLALLCVNVSCLFAPNPVSYPFSKTDWAMEKEFPSYDLNKGESKFFSLRQELKERKSMSVSPCAWPGYVYVRMLKLMSNFSILKKPTFFSH